MPPISWPEVIWHMLPRYRDAFHLLMAGDLPLGLKLSSGTENVLTPAMRFLNYPFHTKAAEIPVRDIYVLSGWLYVSKGAWIAEEVRTSTGNVAASRFERRSSPDVQQRFNDPGASNQRFWLLTRCSDDCLLILRTPEGNTTQRTLAELRNAPIDLNLGKGRVRIDSVDFQKDPEYAPSPFDRLCGQIRNAVMIYYKWILWPTLMTGLMAFLISALVFWRRSVWNLCFVMALVCWGLAFERTTLLLLIDSTSFPALNSVYLGPAYYILVCGAVLSIAAWLQLYRSSDKSMQDATAVNPMG